MWVIKFFLLKITVGILGLYVACHFIDEVIVEKPEFIIYAGLMLGLINFFIKPIISFITLPIRIITLGLFTFFINIAIIWFVVGIFAEITIEGFVPLIYTTLIIWILDLIITITNK